MLVLVAFGPASGKVYIDINAPTVRQLPLAVPALQKSGPEVGQAHIEIARVLRWDLTFTGMFELLDPAGYLEDPQRAPVQPEAAAFADWFAVGAEVLIKGRIEVAGDSLSVDLWAYDVLRRESLLGRHYTGPTGAARDIAHRFANALVGEFTGTPGPFGTEIAYVAQRGKGKELARVYMDGAAPSWLTESGSISINPAWSRDGKYVYFTAYLLGGPDLYVLDRDTRRTWVVSKRKGIDLGGRDAPDGKSLLLSLSFSGNPEIYRLDKATRKTTRLTRSRAIDVAPAWSPDGSEIVFVSDRMGNPHLFVMGADGGDVRRLTYSGPHNGDPDWSPRGDQIAFSGQDEHGVFQVYLVTPRTRKVRQLTFGAYDTKEPSWSPDGRFLAVTSARDGEKAIYVIRVGGGETRRISPRGQIASQPSWSPAGP